jgi:heme-degrading monooxygenase HmoA
MIVRTWHGIVPLEKAEGFRKHLQNTGVAEAKSIKGNKGAYIYSQSQGDFEHFFMVSYWENIESIHSFAGLKPHIAVTYPEDDQY